VNILSLLTSMHSINHTDKLNVRSQRNLISSVSSKSINLC